MFRRIPIKKNATSLRKGQKGRPKRRVRSGPKAPTRKSLEKQIDSLAAQICKERHNYTCARCGRNLRATPHEAHWAHIISRAKKSVRWEENNSLCLCFGCHIGWQHLGGNTVEFVRLAENTYGRSAIDAMWYKSQKPAKFSLADLSLLKRALEQRLAELTRNG